MLIDGEWQAHDGGYALKLGETFLGHVRQRGGDGIYAGCWIVSLNGKQVQEVSSDRDYAQALAMQLICDELERIRPHIDRIAARLPPRDCFWGEGSYLRWKNWKVEQEISGWSFHAPTPQAAIKAMRGKKA